MSNLVFHPSASEELDGAIGFYEFREKGLGLNLESEVRAGLIDIQSAPQRWPKHQDDTRSYLLHRFPFHLIYLEMPNNLWIVAVAHCSRKPGYWKDRIPNIKNR